MCSTCLGHGNLSRWSLGYMLELVNNYAEGLVSLRGHVSSGAEGGAGVLSLGGYALCHTGLVCL